MNETSRQGEGKGLGSVIESIANGKLGRLYHAEIGGRGLEAHFP